MLVCIVCFVLLLWCSGLCPCAPTSPIDGCALRSCSSQALKAHPGLRLFSAWAIKDCSAHFAYASFATAVIDGLFSSRSSRLSNSPRLTPLVRPTLTRTCSSQLRVSFAHLCTRLHSLSAAALSSFDLCS